VAVVTVREKWKGRGGRFCYLFIPNDSGRRYFQIHTNAITDDLATVYAATYGSSIPAQGSLFPGSFTLTCRDVDYQNDEKSPYFWDVTCNYSDAPDQAATKPEPAHKASGHFGRHAAVYEERNLRLARKPDRQFDG